MRVEFSGIERRLDELSERLARLAPLCDRPRADFSSDPYLRDIVERNFEIAAQCCIDICHRIIAIEGAQKPRDYHPGARLLPGGRDGPPAPWRGHAATFSRLMNLSARAYHRVLKLARMIADLAGSDRIQPAHIATATACGCS